MFSFVKNHLLLSILALMGLAVSLGTEPAMTQEMVATNVRAAAQAEQGPTDPAELEAFLDTLMAEQMEEYHVAGAAISVVKDGELFFSKGYGYADMDQGIPVDPEQTIFGIGSVPKTLVWTAVMQLVEQGKLDLEADINTYLDFQIPDTFPEPIRLKHLLSQTSGFEDRVFEGFAATTDDFVPTQEWVPAHVPARVRPPGQIAAYSNYGSLLGAYIVERVSGMSYVEYVERNILIPLGMEHSTFTSQFLRNWRCTSPRPTLMSMDSSRLPRTLPIANQRW